MPFWTEKLTDGFKSVNEVEATNPEVKKIVLPGLKKKDGSWEFH